MKGFGPGGGAFLNLCGLHGGHLFMTIFTILEHGSLELPMPTLRFHKLTKHRESLFYTNDLFINQFHFQDIHLFHFQSHMTAALKLWTHRAAAAASPSAAAAAAASRSIGKHCDAPKSVPDPFQASWQASPCISMDLDAAAATAADAAAAARCVHTLTLLPFQKQFVHCTQQWVEGAAKGTFFHFRIPNQKITRAGRAVVGIWVFWFNFLRSQWLWQFSVINFFGVERHD